MQIRNLFYPGSGIRDGKIRIRDKHLDKHFEKRKLIRFMLYGRVPYPFVLVRTRKGTEI
jgi:hypothetical protein